MAYKSMADYFQECIFHRCTGSNSTYSWWILCI